MPRTITLVEGDTAKPITGTLHYTNEAGALVPQDLTGASLELHLKDPASAAPSTVLPVSVTEPLAGRYSIPGSARAALASGEYDAEMVVEYADGSRDIFPSDERAIVINRARRT